MEYISNKLQSWVNALNPFSALAKTEEIKEAKEIKRFDVDMPYACTTYIGRCTSQSDRASPLQFMAPIETVKAA